jgi:predicted phage terminase large subunit-like protein
MTRPAVAEQPKTIRAQPGPQEVFLSTPADIAIFGGAAFGGKSFALLLEGLRHVNNPGFGAVIFRRETTQVRAEGGLWDTACSLYGSLGAYARDDRLEQVFNTGAKVKFAHLEHDRSAQAWDGSQIPLLGFDELQHFTWRHFWALVARNRSTCGVRPYTRATCNPDPDSWVRDFISWWIGPDGYPIANRSGELRWLLRAGDDLHWFDTRAEALRARTKLGLPADVEPKSVTFVPAGIDDNPIGNELDPSYRATLYALGTVDRERLLHGNWNVRETAGTLFQRAWVANQMLDTPPDLKNVTKQVRYWDRAATEPNAINRDPDWTRGVRMSSLTSGAGDVVEDVVSLRGRPRDVRELIRATSEADGHDVTVVLERDPGQAGKAEAEALVEYLAGFNVRTVAPTGDKKTRFKPFSAQAEHGNIWVVRSAWNTVWFSELEAFPDGKHDDQADATSGAFNFLHQRPKKTIGVW